MRASYLISKNIAMNSKPSTSIKIFEKVVEPILLYNCEISHAYMPKTWDYNKFSAKLWETGSQVNNVVLGFLRQVLGVHKKSSTIAILAETGKYPICVKIFTHIVKYWVRLCTCENDLLSAARQSITDENVKDNQNWLKIVNYLLKITNIEQQPTQNTLSNKKLINTFKQHIKVTYEKWWRLKMQPEDSTKFDFYYKYKKNYIFEEYLDTIPRHIRLYTTRLRTSSHNLPVETMRYIKPKPKREDRLCRICNLKEVGDEHHYLIQCSNPAILPIRTDFFINIRNEIKQFEHFNDTNIIEYCMIMSDSNIHSSMTQYIKEILVAFKEEMGEIKPILAPVITRSGRQVKVPEKLDL